MPNFTDDELDYIEHEEKRKREDRQRRHEFKIEIFRAIIGIIIALIALFGVIFAAVAPVIPDPSSPSGERISIIAAIIFRDGNHDDLPTLTPTPHLDEPSVASTLIIIDPTNAPEIQPTSTPLPTDTAVPAAIPAPVEFTINGNADPDKGVTRFDCPTPGSYEVRYENGAYFVNSKYGWRTVILILVDRPFQWSTKYVIDPQPDNDYFVGNYGAGDGVQFGYPTSQEAQAAYQASATIDCQSYMLLMPMDIRGAYNGEKSSANFDDLNRGSVTITIEKK
jgi:hypothetical protein